MAQTISVKVNVPKLQTVLDLELASDAPVFKVCKDIRAAANMEDVGADHALFMPSTNRWLENGRIFGTYDIKDGELLEYRKKHRPLKVRALDGSVKSMLIDETDNISKVTETVAQRFGLSSSEEYSLMISRETVQIVNKLGGKKEKKITNNTWLKPDKTLREQGVSEDDLVLFKKKYFFSDSKLDRNDPVQLNLVYVQCRDTILDGELPCTIEEACQLAAMQMQAQAGDYRQDYYRNNQIKWKDYMTRQHSKKRDVEKKVANEHRKLAGVSELDAKYRYVQLCRSLNTYGITFYAVEEKRSSDKKGKPIPRLLGISREKVVLVDVDSNAIVKTWPLTNLRRWSATPSTFILDFGDYSDAHFVVLTTEGESISHLISGYIDIIMRKKKEAERIVDDADEEFAMAGDELRPIKASAIKLTPAAAAYVGDMNAAQTARYGVIDQSEAGTGRVWSSRDGLSQQVNSGLASITTLQAELNTPANLPPIGRDPASLQWKQQTLEMNRQTAATLVGSQLAATAAIIGELDPDNENVDYDAVQANLSTMSSNLVQLTAAAKMAAALQDDPAEAERILEYSRQLNEATARFYAALAAGGTKEGNLEMIAAAQGVSVACSNLLSRLNEQRVPRSAQHDLIEQAKAVSAATAVLVENSKRVAAQTTQESRQAELLEQSKRSAGAAAKVITCAQVVAPTLNNPLCMEQLVGSVRSLESAYDGIGRKGEACRDPVAAQALVKSQEALQREVDKLLAVANECASAEGNMSASDSPLEQQCELLLAALHKLVQNPSDSATVVQCAQILATSSTDMISRLKEQAERESSPDEKQRLLTAVRDLADSTSKVINAAKDTARDPQNLAKREALNQAAQELEVSARFAVAVHDRQRVFNKLATASKAHSAALLQLIAAAKGASSSNRNQGSQQQLVHSSKTIAEVTAPLLTAVRTYDEVPEDASAQLRLVSSARSVIGPTNQLLASAKAAAPTVGDAAAQAQLNKFSAIAARTEADLKRSIEVADAVTSSLELHNALMAVKRLKREAEDSKDQAIAGTLKPLTDSAEVDQAQLELGATAKSISSSLAQMISAAKQGNRNHTGVAAADSAMAMQSLASGVTNIITQTSDPESRRLLMENLIGSLDTLDQLLQETKEAVEGPMTAERVERLNALARGVNESVEQLLNSTPGQRELNHAMEFVAVESERLGRPVSVKVISHPTEAQQRAAKDRLLAAAANLSAASNRLVAASSSRASPKELQVAAKEYEVAFAELVAAGQNMMQYYTSEADRQKILAYLQDAALASTRLLLSQKALVQDPESAAMRGQLLMAAQGVADSMNQLMESFAPDANTARQFDAGLRQLQMSMARSEAVNSAAVAAQPESYIDCMIVVAGNREKLTNATAAAQTAARFNDLEKLSQVSTAQALESVQSASSAANRAAYLIGVADPMSAPAVPGLIDQEELNTAVQAARAALRQLRSGIEGTQPVSSEEAERSVDALTQATTQLCFIGSSAADQTANASAKQHFDEATTDLSDETATLSIAVRDWLVDPEAKRKAAMDHVDALSRQIDDFAAYAGSGEFRPTSAQFSPVAQQQMEPVLRANRALLAGTASYLESVKLIAGGSRDSESMVALANHSKDLNETMRQLVLVMENNIPGHREMDAAIEQINQCIAQIDRASLDTFSGAAAQAQTQDQAFRETLMNNCQAIASSVDMIHRESYGGSCEHVGPMVLQLSDNFKPFVTAAVSAANSVHRAAQEQIFEQSKDLCFATQEFLLALKEVELQNDPTRLETCRTRVADVGSKLVNALERATGGIAEINAATEAVRQSAATLDQRPTGAAVSYAAHVERLTQAGKTLTAELADVYSRSRTPTEAAALASRIQTSVADMTEQTRFAMATADNEETRRALKQSATAVCDANVGLLESLRLVLAYPNDMAARQGIGHSSREVTQQTAKLVRTAQDGARGGVQRYQDASERLNAIVQDLFAAQMFSSVGGESGELEASKYDAAAYERARAQVLSQSRELLKQAAVLRPTPQGTSKLSDAELATATNSLVQSVSSVRDSSKTIALCLAGDAKAQERVLNGSRACASSTKDLIDGCTARGAGATSGASFDGHYAQLEDAVASLTASVNAVGDRANRVQRVANDHIHALQTDVASSAKRGVAPTPAQPHEVVACARQISAAAANLVSVAPTGAVEETVHGLDSMAKLSHELIKKSRACASGSPAERSSRLEAALPSAVAQVCTLFERVGTAAATVGGASSQTRSDLLGDAKAVADALGTVVAAAGDKTDSVSLNADMELLAAASMIEAAIAKLARVRPIHTGPEGDYEAGIIEAVRAIAAATSALIVSASAAQGEIVLRDIKVPGKPYHQDPTWSDGLVSAARAVAGATSELCDSANLVAQGRAEPERVVASARAVSASTAQLLAAAVVRLDQFSKSKPKLNEAAGKIREGAEQLVQAAMRGAPGSNTNNGDIELASGTTGRVQEMEAQMRVLKMEKELEEARGQLARLRKNRYDPK